MKDKHIIIIGLGVGGFSALMAAKKTAPDANITVIEKRDYDMFSPCGLPFVIEGIIPDPDDLIHNIPTESMGVKKLLNHEAVSIDVDKRTVKVVEMTTGSEQVLEFDSLILAPGSKPFIPPIPGAEELLQKGVFTVSCPEDTARIIQAANGVAHAVVMGAGPIGLEVATALKAKGLEVAVVELLDWVFPKALDKDMASIVGKALKARGMELITGKAVEKVVGKDYIESVTVGGQTLNTGMLVAASGVKPDLSLGREAGLHQGRFGITTDMKMMTNARNVYAAGDCIEVTNPLSHRPWVSQLANSAYRQGMVAGTNAAGGYATYDGAFTTFVSVAAGLEVAATGFNTYFAKMYGFDIIGAKAKGKTRPDWYPGGEEITVKVLADAISGKLLGAQGVGSGAASRINVVACALRGGLTVHELAELELAYCPAVSETYDALTKACDFVVRKLQK